jgi:hypothetical protein
VDKQKSDEKINEKPEDPGFARAKMLFLKVYFSAHYPGNHVKCT